MVKSLHVSVLKGTTVKGEILLNLNSSNTNGSFTVANSNSFLSPYENLRLAQENKYLGTFNIFRTYFIMNLYVVCTH